ncbi:hypothetical protein CVV65_09630 [Kyrpidia spormannii]|uniref:Uncharacterized protein n=2 Tax=Kyrpidia spormannii TaxID=2055160 RepID=A0A2K8N7S5_9BACL|nr:hypothetical protein [Kyrpidia spormannii]ATY85155.1 hypothetical protein CVV65_09630 [Kyrpidia spormannii]CAB3392814.1 conserved protein of unknown function [Kyrpidia spormannii]CAB3393726.1 conserved protein of unknown function [Kyrpidia spormannii]HHY66078.1 hypothetical protein [Alicyclobacillus sp.]
MVRKLSIALIWIGGIATGAGFVARVAFALDPRPASIFLSIAFAIFLIGMILFILSNIFLPKP